MHDRLLYDVHDTLGTFPNEDFPLAPASVRNAYDFYWRVTHANPQHCLEDQKRLTVVNALINDFCSTYVRPQVYDAALLSQFIDNANDDILGHNSMRALKMFYEESSDDDQDKKFMLGLLEDRAIIADFWDEQIATIYANEPERLALLTDATNTCTIDGEMWERRPIGPRAEDILKLRAEHGVNFESLLIASAQTLEWLHSGNAQNDTATLQKMHIAESLYAPLAEIVGFDGIAMALQSRCAVLRKHFTGKDKYVHKAINILDDMGNPDVVERRTQRMLEAVFGESVHEQVLTHTGEHGIIIGEGICTQKDYRINWRRKSVGSLARKLEASINNEVPMDVIGVTVITNDASEIGSLLSDVVNKASYDPRITLSPAPSRNSALHIKGTPDYINQVGEAMGYTCRGEIDNDIHVVETTPDGYHVAKVTLKFQVYGEPLPMHVELQFNTAHHRIEARIGSAAHALYKLSGGTVLEPKVQAQALSEIRRKKIYLGGNTLTPMSQARSSKLEERIQNVTFAH